MDNNNKEFNMEDLNEFVKMINTGSPAHIIDFNDNKNSILVGYYLGSITEDEFRDKFVSSLKLPKRDSDIIVFESRHLVESCSIIYGILYNLYHFDDEKAKSTTTNILRIMKDSSISDYGYIKKEISKCCDLVKTDNKRLKERIDNIIANIWFLPYSQFDYFLKASNIDIKEGTENE